MKTKISLQDLEIESFLTVLENGEAKKLEGGLLLVRDTYTKCDNTGKTLDCSGWLCDSTDVSQQSECESCGRECVSY